MVNSNLSSMATRPETRTVIPAGTALAEYDDFTYSEAIDCAQFLQMIFKFYQTDVVGGLYWVIEGCDDPIKPQGDGAGSWVPAITGDGGGAAVDGTDYVVPSYRAVDKCLLTGNFKSLHIVDTRWVRIGVAAGTAGGSVMVTATLLPLSSR